MTFTVLAILAMLVIVSCALLVNAYVISPRTENARLFEDLVSLGKAMEIRFPNQAGLTPRIVEIVTDLADSIPLGRQDRAVMIQAAYLRDIGLSEVPYQLGNSVLSLEELEQDPGYLQHAERGARMLESSSLFSSVSDLIRWHHVRFADYVENPKIPYGANILRIAVDLAVAEKEWGPNMAVNKLRDGSGTIYDPKLVEIIIGDHKVVKP